MRVLTLGIDVPFSILAITGCFTPVNSSSSFCEIPFSRLAFINSKIKATLKSLSAFSSGVNSSFLTSSQAVTTIGYSSTLLGPVIIGYISHISNLLAAFIFICTALILTGIFSLILKEK